MKPTHHRATTVKPVHPSQIRDQVKEALAALQAQLKEEEAAMEAALLAAHREVRVSTSVPMLCMAALAIPGVTLRQAFQAVAVQTGFHESHVQRLYYRTKPNRPHVVRLKGGSQ